MKEIELTQGMVALVDDEDYDMVVKNGPWYAHRESYRRNDGVPQYYAQKSLAAGGKLHMSWLIIGEPPKGFEVDHINQIKLDNRRKNLRITTRSVNMWNRNCIVLRENSVYGVSKYKGVTWDKERKKWLAQICIGKKVNYIGRFDNEIDAAIAYNKAKNNVK